MNYPKLEGERQGMDNITKSLIGVIMALVTALGGVIKQVSDINKDVETAVSKRFTSEDWEEFRKEDWSVLISAVERLNREVDMFSELGSDKVVAVLDSMQRKNELFLANEAVVRKQHEGLVHKVESLDNKLLYVIELNKDHCRKYKH